MQALHAQCIDGVYCSKKPPSAQSELKEDQYVLLLWFVLVAILCQLSCVKTRIPLTLSISCTVNEYSGVGRSALFGETFQTLVILLRSFMEILPLVVLSYYRAVHVGYFMHKPFNRSGILYFMINMVVLDVSWVAYFSNKGLAALHGSQHRLVGTKVYLYRVCCRRWVCRLLPSITATCIAYLELFIENLDIVRLGRSMNVAEQLLNTTMDIV